MDRKPEERKQSKAEGESRIEGATPCSVLFALSLAGKSIASLNRPFQAKVGWLWSQLHVISGPILYGLRAPERP